MSKKLLLADDSITIQKVIQITFAHEDYQLTITDNGDSAFDRVRQLLPDLVLADIYMPGLSGYELCAAIKQAPALQHIPVLLLAGSFEPFDEGKARAAGADGWIEKPFESQALIDKVRELLAASESKGLAAMAGTAEEAPKMAAESVAAMAAPLPDFSFGETATAATEPAEFVFEDLASKEPDFEFSDETFMAKADQLSTLVTTPSSAPFAAETAAAALEPAEFEFEELSGDKLDFEFSDMPSAAEVEPSSSMMAQPLADVVAPAGFAANEEILPLADEDIIGAEDLEPVTEVPTLTPWTRGELPAEESLPAVAEVEEPSAVAAEEPFPAVAEIEELSAVAAEEPFPAVAGIEEPSAVAAEEPFPAVAEIEELSAVAAEEPCPAVAEVEEPSAVAAEEPFPAVAEIEEPSAVAAEEPFPSFAEVEEPSAVAAEVTAPAATEFEVASPVDVEFVAPAVSQEVSLPAAVPAVQKERAQTLTELSEEELERIVERAVTKALEKLAGTVVEKVVWEVVPDLAEALIKEEIRQIKEAAG